MVRTTRIWPLLWSIKLSFAPGTVYSQLQAFWDFYVALLYSLFCAPLVKLTSFYSPSKILPCSLFSDILYLNNLVTFFCFPVTIHLLNSLQPCVFGSTIQPFLFVVNDVCVCMSYSSLEIPTVLFLCIHSWIDIFLCTFAFIPPLTLLLN